MRTRSDVEQEILSDEAALEEIATLLESGTELSTWPTGARAALGLALDDESASRAESWKIAALRRHLFGAGRVLAAEIGSPDQPSGIDRRRAERVRSGLLARVRYRVAEYLSSAT